MRKIFSNNNKINEYVRIVKTAKIIIAFTKGMIKHFIPSVVVQKNHETINKTTEIEKKWCIFFL